jgi:hypothetical protein
MWVLCVKMVAIDERESGDKKNYLFILERESNLKNRIEKKKESNVLQVSNKFVKKKKREVFLVKFILKYQEPDD